MKLVLLAAALLSATSSLAHGPVPTFNDFLTRSLGNGTFDERSGVFTAHDAQAFDERSVFDASVGIMIERDMLPGGAGAREKRSIGSEPKTTRDVLRREVELDLNERGEISWPANFDDVSRLAKRAKRKAVKKTSRKFSAFITWYTGKDLQNPYCADRSGWTPTDSSMIAAVTLNWGKNRPACGSYLALKAPNGRSVVVRLVDMCGGCKPGVPHVDLSQSAFKALYGLGVGKVGNVKVSVLGHPPVASSYNAKHKNKYGPTAL